MMTRWLSVFYLEEKNFGLDFLAITYPFMILDLFVHVIMLATLGDEV
jgi:hypothetical protein